MLIIRLTIAEINLTDMWSYFQLLYSKMQQDTVTYNTTLPYLYKINYTQ